MQGLPQLRILHVSDIHFGKNHICNPADPTASRSGIPSLASLIRGDLKSVDWESSVWAIQQEGLEPTPLLIAATGDLTQKADPSEFDEACEFLRNLQVHSVLGTQIEPRHLFVVPGNHDVVFDRPEPEHRFQPYCGFYNKLFKSLQPEQRGFARPEDAVSLTQVHAFPESQFLVAEINSCYYVQSETIDESRGQVSADAIASLRRQLEQHVDKQWIKIALVHHHPVLLPTFVEAGRGYDSIVNGYSLLCLLREHGFQLILHGHKHHPQVFSYDPESAWAPPDTAVSQLIVAGGSCGSSALPEGSQKCNTYNLITVKWNPEANQARVQVVTRGLKRMGPDRPLDPDQWSWETIRTFDKLLSTFEHLPVPRAATRVPFSSDAAEQERDSTYQDLRLNMPVAEVLPSLLPGQAYEARAWLVQHRHHSEFPTRVIWSAGQMFERKVCEREAAPEFCAAFHYWGPMLLQAELQFADGHKARAYLYARLPDSRSER